MIKILIVEDEPGIYTFLQEGLTDEGYDTLVATDGSDALRDLGQSHHTSSAGQRQGCATDRPRI